MVNRLKFTPQAEEKFIEHIRKTANVSAACRLINVSPTAAYERKKEHPDFSLAWDEAIAEAADDLEFEARRRAYEGVDEPVFHKGEQCGVIRRYSDRLMDTLLRGHKPDRYRQNVSVEHDISDRLSERMGGARERD